MSDTPQLLLAHHLKALKLPTFLREYDKQARQCAAEGVDHVRYLVSGLIDRERRMVERSGWPSSPPSKAWTASTSKPAIAQQMMVLELARCEYIERRENVIALGNSGTGKTHIALGSVAACQKGLTVGFIWRRLCPRAHRGQGREAPVAVPEAVSKIQAADHR